MKNIRELFAYTAITICLISSSLAGEANGYSNRSGGGLKAAKASSRSFIQSIVKEKRIHDPLAKRRPANKQFYADISASFDRSIKNGLLQVAKKVAGMTGVPAADILTFLHIESECGLKTPYNIGRSEAETFIEYYARYGDKALQAADKHSGFFNPSVVKTLKQACAAVPTEGDKPQIGSNGYFEWSKRFAKKILKTRQYWPVDTFFLAARVAADRKTLESVTGRRLRDFALCRLTYKNGWTTAKEEIAKGNGHMYSQNYRDIRGKFADLIRGYDKKMAQVIKKDHLRLDAEFKLSDAYYSPALQEMLSVRDRYRPDGKPKHGKYRLLAFNN